MPTELALEWLDTSSRLQIKIRKIQQKKGWVNPIAAAKVLEGSDEVISNFPGKDIASLFQFSDMDRPDLLCLYNLRYVRGSKKEIVYYLSHNPLIVALRENGEKIGEGVLEPSDDELLLKFAENVFLVIINPYTL